MVNKKGQLKIQQMIFMLLAVTLFFVLIGMMILVISTSDLRRKATFLEEKNALLLVTKLANSPEFACGDSSDNRKTNCVDMDKVMILKNHKEYGNIWGVDNIQIRKIYPESEEDVLCESGTYPNCNVLRIFDREITADYSNFVTLCRKELVEGRAEDKCELGLLMVSYKNK